MTSSIALNEMQQKILLGPNGKTILELTQRFNVFITMPEVGNDIKIEGEAHKKALKAILKMVEAQVTPSPIIPSLSVHSTHTYLKYRLTPNAPQFDEKIVKKWLTGRLEIFLGVVGGGSLDIDVVQGAIILATEFNGNPSSLELLVSSTSLTGMAAPSREISIDKFSSYDPIS